MGPPPTSGRCLGFCFLPFLGFCFFLGSGFFLPISANCVTLGGFSLSTSVSNCSRGTLLTWRAVLRWCSDRPASSATCVRVTDGRAHSCRVCFRLLCHAGGLCRSRSPT